MKRSTFLPCRLLKEEDQKPPEVSVLVARPQGHIIKLKANIKPLLRYCLTSCFQQFQMTSNPSG